MRGRGRRQDSCLCVFDARTPAFLPHPSPLVTNSFAQLRLCLFSPHTTLRLSTTRNAAKMRPTAAAHSEMPGRT